MITLYGVGRIFAEGRGETKDLRVQWALEETGSRATSSAVRGSSNGASLLSRRSSRR